MAHGLHVQDLTMGAFGGEAVDVSGGDQELTQVSRAFYVGVTGDLVVTMEAGGDLTFSNLAVGWHPIRAVVVKQTGTTVTNTNACW